MITVDQFLLKIINSTEPSVEKFLSKRDAKVLRSIANIVSSPNFITENQSRLLLKVIKENSEKFPIFQNELNDILQAPTWSRYFRKVEVVRKIDIITNTVGEQVININFTYSSQIRKILSDICTKITGLIAIQNAKNYHADLTEKNIILLVDTFKSLDFTFDEKIENFYKTIKSWSKNEVKSQFFLENTLHENLQNIVNDDVGADLFSDVCLLEDRSVRYEYFTKNPPKNPENLTEKIAFRKKTKIWINSKEHSFEEIFQSLINLKRLPILLVFDSSDQSSCVENLKILKNTLEKYDNFSKVGVYFRLDNQGKGQEFNKMIANNQYNCQLDNTTEVAVIANGKIPKFFIKLGWKPMSIVSFAKLVNNTKTSVYSNNCDLVITYSDLEPIIETRNIWE